jgi:hypothetical protein
MVKLTSHLMEKVGSSHDYGLTWYLQASGMVQAGRQAVAGNPVHDIFDAHIHSTILLLPSANEFRIPCDIGYGTDLHPCVLGGLKHNSRTRTWNLHHLTVLLYH